MTQPSSNNQIRLHIYTYGQSHGPQPSLNEVPEPVIFSRNCMLLRPLSKELHRRYCGLDPQIYEGVFALDENETLYRQAIETLSHILKDPRVSQGGSFAVLVSCASGVHRSVAVAERMAKEVREWSEFDIESSVKHLDMEHSRQLIRAGKTAKDIPDKRLETARPDDFTFEAPVENVGVKQAPEEVAA